MCSIFVFASVFSFVFVFVLVFCIAFFFLRFSPLQNWRRSNFVFSLLVVYFILLCSYLLYFVFSSERLLVRFGIAEKTDEVTKNVKTYVVRLMR